MVEQDKSLETYKILSEGSSNKDALESAAEYYVEHCVEMDGAYPDLVEKLNQNNDVQDVVKKRINILLSDLYVNTTISNDATDTKQIFRKKTTNGELVYSNAGEYRLTSNLLDNYLSDLNKSRILEIPNVEAVSDEAEEIVQLLSADIQNVIDRKLKAEETFRYPDMGDFYLGNIDDIFFKSLDQKIREKQDAKKAAFYLTTFPRREGLGYDSDNDSFFFKVDYPADFLKPEFFGENGWIDGARIPINLSWLSAGIDNDALGIFKERVCAANSNYPLIENNVCGEDFILELVGIHAPRLPFWATDSLEAVPYRREHNKLLNIKKDNTLLQVKQFDIESLGNSNQYVKTNNASGSPYFVAIGNTWRQIEYFDTHASGFKWLIDPGSIGQVEDKNGDTFDIQQSAILIKNKVIDILKQNPTFYVQIEGERVPEGSTVFPMSMMGFLYNASVLGQLSAVADKSLDGQIRWTGYNAVEMLSYRRYNGRIFLKTSEGLYIDLVKFILADNEDESCIPGVYADTSKYEGKHSYTFGINQYDIDANTYADAFFETMSELDDRPEIQTALRGNTTWQDLYKYNVTIGDTTFFVPPANITIQERTESERIPLIRAKGTAAKTDPHLTRVIHFDLFFNEDRGINGATYQQESPNGSRFVYSINGLRSLMSQFRFTPFLPITSDYINKTLGIDAVTVLNLSMSSVAEYPKLIRAQLAVAEFDWKVYIPDIAQMGIYDSISRLIPEEELENENILEEIKKSQEEYQKKLNRPLAEKLEELRERQKLRERFGSSVQENDEGYSVPEFKTDEYRNWFAYSINWKIFRYYYQRPIIRGDYLKLKPWDFNSDQYIKATSGVFTSYIPMSFMEPYLKIYIANEDYLKEILRRRYELQKGKIGDISFSPQQIAFLKMLDAIYLKLIDMASNEAFISKLNVLNQKIKDRTATDYRDAGENIFQKYISSKFDLFDRNRKASNKKEFIDKWFELEALYPVQVEQDIRELLPVTTDSNVIAEKIEEFKSLKKRQLSDSEMIKKDFQTEILSIFGWTEDQLNRTDSDIVLKEYAQSVSQSMGGLLEFSDKDYFSSLKTSHKGDGSARDMNDLLDGIKTAVSQVTDIEFIEDFSFECRMSDNNDEEKTGIISYALTMHIRESGLSKTDLDSIRANVGYFCDVESSSVFEDDRIHIPIGMRVHDIGLVYDEWKDLDGVGMYIMSDHPDVQVLTAAGHLAKNYARFGINADESPDVYNLINLKYNLYDLEDNVADTRGEVHRVLITNWSANMSNRISQIRTLSNDGSAPQYMGGEDVTLSLQIKTKNIRAVSKLAALPKEVSRLTRTYHMVMPCVPLRIDSEITRFLGVNEVTLENVVIEASNEETGVYTVRIDIVSMDRTVRAREAVSRKSLNNDGVLVTAETPFSFNDSIPDSQKTVLGTLASTQYNTALDFISDLLNPDANVLVDEAQSMYLQTANQNVGGGIEQTIGFHRYFEVKDALGEIDLYPDLELPSIKEMESIGYNFLRYAFQDERVYVDPDFYFVYPLPISSQIYREISMHVMDAGGGSIKLRDSMGAEATLIPSAHLGYYVADVNDKFQQENSAAKKVRSIEKEQTAKKLNLKDNLKDSEEKDKFSFVDISNYLRDKDSWKVGPDINCVFLESNFKREIDSYLNRKDSVLEDETLGSNSEDSNNAEEMRNVIRKRREDNNEDAESKEDKIFVEGKFAYEKLQSAQEAANSIMEYLSNTAIDIGTDIDETTVREDALMDQDRMETTIKNAVEKFMGLDNIKNFFEAIYIDFQNNKFVDITRKMFWSAACAASGRKEYAGSKSSSDWKPQIDYIGVAMSGTGQDAAGRSEIRSYDCGSDGATDPINTVVKFGTCFSIFNIKMYTRDEIILITGKDPGDKTRDGNPSTTIGNVNYHLYLLDPFYLNSGSTAESIEQYKRNCIVNLTYATFAFCRIVMFWLCKLVFNYAIPNMTIDAFRSLSNLELNIEATTNRFVADAGTVNITNAKTGKITTLRNHVNFFLNNVYAMDTGKIWAAIVLTLTDGTQSVLSKIDTRDYTALNAYLETCSSPSPSIDRNSETSSLLIRKLVRALVATEAVDTFNSIGNVATDPAVEYSRREHERKYIEAADDPYKYIPHSYHDMVVHDARGRMLRAFPTFYMCFIDEGREIGSWKLHDNFYNTSALIDVEIVKSRKIPADTANIVLSNFYNSFTTEMEDYIKTPVATIEQAWNSIWSPSEYFQEIEAIRRNRPMDVRLRIRPGARIHVRLGYGNNASMLPVVFNGVVAEVQAGHDTGRGHVVELVAQGDGIELTNPILEDVYAEQLRHLDKLSSFSWDNGDTPLQIISGLFNSHGGMLKRYLRENLKINLFSRNPFGIVHFGNPNFTSLNKGGETMQNIFEASSSPTYAGNVDISDDWYAMAMPETPNISIEVFQKTPWDILNICKGVTPDAICAVTPFNFRSTCFMGLPRYYFCYDYYRDIEGVVQEKRKPYQQWHLYTSVNDIIGDGIVATTRDIHTAALGLYQDVEMFGIQQQKSVGPLWADFDIFPECQKTMIVDTGLLGKGLPFIGTLTSLASKIGGAIPHLEEGAQLLDDQGILVSNEKIAWRLTASALRESVQDMYAGDLVVIGDPSVKPHDRFFLNDAYSSINGQALVKEVVHSLSIDKGFITTISPDCIATVDDKHEIVRYEAANKVGALCATYSEIGKHILAGGAPVLASYLLLGGPGVITSMVRAASAMKVAAQYGNQYAKTKILGWLNNSSSLTRVAGKIGVGLRYSAAAAGGALVASVGSVLAAGGMLASILICPVVNELVASKLRNLKVIQLFPLKKFGHVYIAGFEGSKGTVYGSPTWNDGGIIEEIISTVQGSPVANFIAGLVLSDETKAMAEKFKKDNNIVDNNGDPTYDAALYGKILAHYAGDELSYRSNNYTAQQMKPRVSYTVPRSVINSYNHFKIDDVDKYQDDPKLREQRLISQDARISPYIDENFFVVIHEEQGLVVGDYVKEEMLEINGIEYRIKAISCKDGKNNDVKDIPMLHPDALNVLYEILRRTKNQMPSANSTDTHEDNKYTQNSFIVLKSALRVGDQTSMASTGFVFTLEATDDNSRKALKAALEGFLAESKRNLFGIEDNIFEYVENEKNEICISVILPEVAVEELTEKEIESARYSEGDTSEQTETTD